MSFVNSSGLVHTEKVLSVLATEYNPGGFIGRSLVSAIPTNGEMSGSFRTRNKRNMFQTQNGELGELGMPAEVSAGYGTATFACENYGKLARLPINIESQADAPLNLRKDAVMVAKNQLLMDEEQRYVDIFTATGSYASGNYATLSGTDQWSDYNNSDPIGDVDTYCDALYASPSARKIGWCGRAVWLKLKEHPQIVERVKYGGSSGNPAGVSRQAVAALFGLDDLLVSDLRSTATNPGQTAVYSRMWGKHFGVACVEPGTSTMFLGFAARFEHQNEQVTEVIEQLPGLKGAWVVKVAHSVDEVVIANDAAILLKDAVA